MLGGTIFNYCINKLSDTSLTIRERSYDTKHINKNLKSHEEVLRDIYTTLMSNETFLNFGNKKVIIITAIVEGIYYQYHHNVLIDNNTTTPL